jgi:hypothetical protein
MVALLGVASVSGIGLIFRSLDGRTDLDDDGEIVGGPLLGRLHADATDFHEALHGSVVWQSLAMPEAIVLPMLDFN